MANYPLFDLARRQHAGPRAFDQVDVTEYPKARPLGATFELRRVA